MEGGAADAHQEVNGVSGLAGIGAVPVMVLDDDLAAPLAGDGVVVGARGSSRYPSCSRTGCSGVWRAARISAFVQALRRDKSERGQVMVFSPVGLHEHAVDLVESDDLFAVADRFEHGEDAEVAGAPQDAFEGACDERDGLVAEGIVPEPHDVNQPVTLGIDEGFRKVLKPRGGRAYNIAL